MTATDIEEALRHRREYVQTLERTLGRAVKQLEFLGGTVLNSPSSGEAERAIGDATLCIAGECLEVLRNGE